MAAMAQSLAGSSGVTDELAFEHLFTAEYARVVGIAQRVLGDPAEAEDVAQDVFYSFYTLHSPTAPFAAPWLYRAAAHTALNRIRSRSRRETREKREAVERVGLSGAQQTALDPAQVAVRNEEAQAVRLALARLPERSAAVLALRYSGLSYAEIAHTLTLSINQIGTTLRRAEAALRKEMTRVTPR